MTALSNEAILKLLKEPKNKSQVVKAVKHDDWLKFHAEESLSRNDTSGYIQDFEASVSKILPADKFNMFKNMMSFPVYSNELVNSISDEYAKVYEAQNSSFTYEFTNARFEADYKQYLEGLNFSSEWKDKSHDAMVKNISSVIIVDMPQEQAETSPYFYFLPIAKVCDVSVDKTGKIEYIITSQADGNKLFIDATRYAMFSKNKDDNYSFSFESLHGLGYCPACFFWTESIKKSEPIVKKSPLTSALGNLNKLVRNETFRDMAELAGAFPIVITWKSDCDYYETENGVQVMCNEGFLHMERGRCECPACAKSKLLGPGTLLEIEAPRSKEDPNNLDAVKTIGAEVETLDYLTKRIDSLWDEIYYDCTGWGGEEGKQAMNEKQVMGNFESKQNVLFSIKKNLEISHKFTVDTIARLRYGQSFVSSQINYGTKFYLQSSQGAQEEYKAVKESGAPAYLLNYKRTQVDLINTKGNHNDAERLKILQHLEPWIDLTLQECITLGLNLTKPDDFMLKADFSRLILKFESEYGSIIEFGRMVNFKTKIDKIYQTLINYGKDNKGAIAA